MIRSLPGGTVKMQYVSPDRHAEENGYAEVACQITERTIKSLLISHNLPPSWWQGAAADAEFLLNRFPVTSADVALSSDGDWIRPLEALTSGCYSRMQIDRELSYYVPVGTPCLVHDSRVKGSHLAPKVRWGIAKGMYREQVYFMCPFTKAIFRSKSYTAHKLKQGINYAQFLRLPPLKGTAKSVAIPDDYSTATTIQVTELPEAKLDSELKFVEFTPHNHTTDTDTEKTDEQLGGSIQVLAPDGQPLTVDVEDGMMHYPDDTGNTYDAESSHDDAGAKTPKQTHEQNGGSKTPMMNEQDTNSDQASEDKEKHRLGRSQKRELRLKRQASAKAEAPKHKSTKSESYKPKPKSKTSILNDEIPGMDSFMEIDIEDINSQLSENDLMDMSHELTDRLEAELLEGKTHIAKPNQTLKHIVNKIHKLGPGKLAIYHVWLIQEHGMNPEFIPLPAPGTTNTPVKLGLSLPFPSGQRWRTLVEKSSTHKHALMAFKANTPHQVQGDACKRFVDALVNDAREGAKACEDQLHLRALFTSKLSSKDLRAIQRARKRKLSSRGKAVGAGEEPPPKDLKDAFAHPTRGELWHKAALEEFEGLTDLGVYDHDYSWQDLQDLGIDLERRPPIPMSIALTHKYDSEGQLDRLKVRMAIAGHKGNMQKGVHYDQTFAPTPNQHSMRMLHAMFVRKRTWKRKSFDIKQAYCWAQIPGNKLVAVKYPKGFERYWYDDEGNRHESYIVLRRNLYGMPDAARAWSQCRDKFLLSHFKKMGWAVKRSICDPCLFHFIKPPVKPKGGDSHPKGNSSSQGQVEECLAIIHTDDVDMIGSSEEILKEIMDECDKEWKVKEVPSDFILGVKRETIETKDEFSVELTMTPYIEGMVKAFEDHSRPTRVSTPFPTGQAGFFTKSQPVPEEESKRVLDRGYMRLVGMLLWVSRNIAPDCAYGTSMLCKLMSCPSEKSWDAGMHMLTWLYQNKHKGIKFTHNGNPEPIAFADASFMPDPTDSKRQYGYVIMWHGGPIAYSSRKSSHMGMSSAHSEYMAMSECYKSVVLMRNILNEVGMAEAVLNPTVLFGDNNAANRLTEEMFVSTGMQYIYMPYHHIKEGSMLGEVKIVRKKSQANLADIFTKNVTSDVVKSLLNQMTGYQLNDWISDVPESDWKLAERFNVNPPDGLTLVTNLEASLD